MNARRAAALEQAWFEEQEKQWCQRSGSPLTLKHEPRPDLSHLSNRPRHLGRRPHNWPASSRLTLSWPRTCGAE